MENKRSLGSKKEALAVEFLEKRGVRITDRNYYFPGGELDIVAKQNEYLIFAEVKYRKNTEFGYPFEAVTPAKQKKIISGARHYMYEHRIPFDTPCRFDVISICEEEIIWIENAFCLT